MRERTNFNKFYGGSLGGDTRLYFQKFPHPRNLGDPVRNCASSFPHLISEGIYTKSRPRGYEKIRRGKTTAPTVSLKNERKKKIPNPHCNNSGSLPNKSNKYT